MEAALVLAVFAATTVVMGMSWAFQRAAGDASWTDVFWTFGTGATLTLTALAPLPGAEVPNARQLVVAALVATWSLRLGVHIAARVARGPEDARYAEFRGEWGAAFQRRMLGLSLIQAPASALLAISVVLAAHAPGASLGVADFAGMAILALAVLGEALADGQLKRFKADPRNRSAVCDVGLWSWSRHPNYFFEWLVWLAFPVIAIRPSEPWTWAAMTAPVVMFLLLRFGSGVPPLEATMTRSRGEVFRLYQARVSPFFPRPPRKIAP